MFPRGRWAEYRPRWRRRGCSCETFFASGGVHVPTTGEEESDSNYLAEGPPRQKNRQLRMTGGIHPRERRQLSSPSAEPVLGLPAARPGAHEVGNDGFIFSLRPIADVAAMVCAALAKSDAVAFGGGRYLSVPLQVELRLVSSCGTGEASAGNNIVQSNMGPRLQAVLLPNCNESKQFSRETFAQLCACPDCAKLGSGWGAVWSLS